MEKKEMKITKKEISEAANKAYPLENARRNMFHDNSGQISRQEAFILGCAFILKKLNQRITKTNTK